MVQLTALRRIPLALYVACSLYSATPAVQAAVDFEVVLSSISAVETGSNPCAVGKAGELSEYQINYVTWKECNVPFQFNKLRLGDAPARAAAHQAALKRIRFLAELLRKRQKAVTPYNLALLWRRPYSLVRSPAVLDYAQRVSHLYSDAMAVKSN